MTWPRQAEVHFIYRTEGINNFDQQYNMHIYYVLVIVLIVLYVSYLTYTAHQPSKEGIISIIFQPVAQRSNINYPKVF